MKLEIDKRGINEGYENFREVLKEVKYIQHDT